MGFVGSRLPTVGQFATHFFYLGEPFVSYRHNIIGLSTMPLQSLLGIVVAHCWWIPVLRAYFPCPDGVEPKMVEVTPE